jgi:hypothetical protein
MKITILRMTIIVIIMILKNKDNIRLNVFNFENFHHPRRQINGEQNEQDEQDVVLQEDNRSTKLRKQDGKNYITKVV